MINKCVKIKDITEAFGHAEHFVTGNQIDPELVELKKRAKQEAEGIDPDLADLVQDFPV